MSYAEPGLHSDVYVWSDGEVIYCDALGKRFETTSRQQMMEHLWLHRRRGHKVPDEALDRLYAELMGIPYETAVEAELRHLRALSPQEWMDR